MASLIRWVESRRRPVDHLLSVDIPSGLDAASGALHDPCFRADTTLCLGAMRPGLLSDRAAEAVGRLRAVPLPFQTPGPDSTAEFCEATFARSLLRRTPVQAHKHERGSVAIWAGSPGMAGAAILASRAALRAGAGLVRCFCDPAIYPLLAVATPEVMVHALDPDRPLPEIALDSDSLLAGPGIGIHPASEKRLGHLLSHFEGRLVLDADALRLLAGNRPLLDSLPADTILTPHPGEFRALMPDAPADRLEAARLWMAGSSPAILLLKGPHSWVADPRGLLSANGSGNPGMATAGMGDVLAGLIAGLATAGYPAAEAARLGAYWHGAAADRAAAEGGEPALTASDAITHLGPAWNVLAGGD